MTVQVRRMVRTDLLRPGDVLLSKRRHWFSSAIAWASGGHPSRRYSHAALVIFGENWIESNDGGVRFIYRKLDKMEMHNHWAWDLVDVSDSAQFDVFRHPLLESDHELAAALNSGLILEVVKKWVGQEYPPLARLAAASPFLSSFPKLKRFALSAYDRFDMWWSRQPDIVAPGPFCSELVTRVYIELTQRTGKNLAVFKRPRGMRLTSPNDLADPRISALRLQPDIVVHEDVNLPDCRDTELDSEQEDQNAKDVQLYSDVIMGSVRTARTVVHTARQIRETVRRMMGRE